MKKDARHLIAKQIIGIGRRASDGKVCFLEEKGTGGGGLSHILGDHKSHFIDKGLTEAQIPDLVLKAACEGVKVGTTGKNRPVFEVSFLGKIYNVAVTVGSNGFIVGANPVSSFKSL